MYSGSQEFGCPSGSRFSFGGPNVVADYTRVQNQPQDQEILQGRSGVFSHSKGSDNIEHLLKFNSSQDSRCHDSPSHAGNDASLYRSVEEAGFDDLLAGDPHFVNNFMSFDPQRVNNNIQSSTAGCVHSANLGSIHHTPLAAESVNNEISYPNDIDWSSFSVIDPLSRLIRSSDETVNETEYSTRHRHSKLDVDRGRYSEPFEKGTSAVDSLTHDSLFTELPNKCDVIKSSSVPPISAQRVPSLKRKANVDSDCMPTESIDSQRTKLEADSSGENSNGSFASIAEVNCTDEGKTHEGCGMKFDERYSTSDTFCDYLASEVIKKKSTEAKQGLFFDPRRIFVSSSKPSLSKPSPKPVNPNKVSSQSTAHKTTADCKKTASNVSRNRAETDGASTENSEVNSTTDHKWKSTTNLESTSTDDFSKDTTFPESTSTTHFGNEKSEEKSATRDTDLPSAGQHDATVLNNQSQSQSHCCNHVSGPQFIRNDLSGVQRSANVHSMPDGASGSFHSNRKQRENCDSEVSDKTISGSEAQPLKKVENADRKYEWKSILKISTLLQQIDKEKIKCFVVWVLLQLSIVLLNILKILVGIALHECSAILSFIVRFACKGFVRFCKFLKDALFSNQDSHTKEETKYTRDRVPGSHGNRFLSQNITLPETGDEAIQRLLSCEGKDPYSILGLKVDCTDEEIRKYYRRQAVLVHPDKNSEPGAEAAFKVLSHAFELIGEPDKRRTYNAQVSNEEEEMQQFSDLLKKMHETMEEAMQYMGCSGCGGKHKRVPVDLPSRAARYCAECDQRHSAKEGDVWAETSRFGFLWRYYACMEGDIYDVTDWVSCQHDKFRHVPSNSHHVHIHISTGRNRQQRAARDAESELKDLFNSMYGAASGGRGAGPAGGTFDRDAYSPDGARQSASKRRRRKRR